MSTKTCYTYLWNGAR